MDRRSSLKSFKGNGEESSVKCTVRETWDCYASNRYCAVGLLNGFAWPPRSYSCSFCKREFRSAQALGGHMNVHRRDRARLRQSPPWENDTSFSNPNSKTSLETKSSKCDPSFSPHVPSPLMMGALPSHACVSSSTNHSSMSKERNDTITASASKSNDWDSNMKALKEWEEEKEEIVMVDLGLKICPCNNSGEDLDLELRLGYS